MKAAPQLPQETALMLERMANDLVLAKHLIRNLNARLCEFVPYEADANRPEATGKQSTDMVFQISTTVWDYWKMKAPKPPTKKDKK